jgi:hypothetical protein
MEVFLWGVAFAVVIAAVLTFLGAKSWPGHRSRFLQGRSGNSRGLRM